MEIVNVPIEEIKPYEKNAKVHDEGQIVKIMRSIQEFGFNRPLVLDKNKVIVVGHGAFEAVKRLNMPTVPALIVDLPEAKIAAFRLADNKLNESEWEMDLVLDEIKAIEAAGLEAALTGFDAAELKLFEPNSETNDHLDKLENNAAGVAVITCPHCGKEFEHQWERNSKNSV